MSKDISLVLGSGGARGLAHIGVIRWLEENDYRVQSLVGCSMGACVGDIYALNKLAEYEQWVRAIRTRDIVSLLDMSWGRSGLVKGDKLINTLRELLGEGLFEELKIKFTAVAVDIHKSREVWISKGPVFDAIRASVSIPLLFTPALLDGRKLIDGAVMNPIPIAPTVGDHTDIVVAVNVSGELSAGVRSAPKRERPKAARSKVQERISQFLESLNPLGGSAEPAEESMRDVVYTAFDAMQSTIARQKLAAYPPDVLIDIPRNVAGMMEFDRAEELIEIGYKAAEKMMRSDIVREIGRL